MIRYAVYDPQTGRITRTGTCSPADLALQGFAIESDVADDRLHYVVNGELQPLPPRPSPHHVWKGAAAGWADDRPLGAIKAAAWAAVKAERSRRLTGTITAGGRTFDLDLPAITLYALDALDASRQAEPWAQDWVLANNTTVTLSAQQMLGLARAAKLRVAAISAAAQALRQRIDAATTPEEVAAIAWPD